MEDRELLARDLLDSVLIEMRDMLLSKRSAVKKRVSVGLAYARAVAKGDLFSRDGKAVGSFVVQVYVPGDVRDTNVVTLSWKRAAYGFWFQKVVKLGEFSVIDEADLTSIWHGLIGVEWAANGIVPLRSMIRHFPKVKDSQVKTGGLS